MALAPGIAASIDRQQSQLLRQGQYANEKFDKIRQRHIWSMFHFSVPGGQISAAGVLGALDYLLFTVTPGNNGQGLPAGFSMTDLDTNFVGANRMPDDQNMSIWEMGVSFLPPRQDIVNANTATMGNGALLASDIDLLCSNMLLSIQYLTNEVILGPVYQFVQPGGPSMTGGSLVDFSTKQGTEIAGAGPAGQTGGIAEGGVAAGAQVTPWSARHGRFGMNSGPMAAAPALRRKLQIPIYLRNGVTFKFILKCPRPVQLSPVAAGGLGGFRARVDWWAVESFREQA